METLVVVAQHRNQYHGRVKANGPGRYGSSPSKSFRDINCRTFQSGSGILPTPIKGFSTPVTKRSTSLISIPPSSPKTPLPSPSVVNINSRSVGNASTKSKPYTKSNPIAIDSKTPKSERAFSANDFQSRSFSERWAGPAYSNSPPPSSLPIPKFSLCPKRTVSLELPVANDVSAGIEIEMSHPIAKSAPASPSRDHTSSSKNVFVSADSATRTLRRILNLDHDDK